MKECVSLFKEQDDLFKDPKGRVEAIKDYISSSKDRLWDGAERRIFELPKDEKIELLRFYIAMFGNVFVLSEGEHLWKTLSEDEKKAILSK